MLYLLRDEKHFVVIILPVDHTHTYTHIHTHIYNIYINIYTNLA